MCISNGHLECAQWFVDHFGLTIEDARANNNWALRTSVSNGHLGCAKWFANRFGLSITLV